MFFRCKSLISLPDISKWDTSNVEDMNEMFYKCKSLISLPDISNLNLSRVISMSHMFSGCNSLISLPDLSKWNISNVRNMNGMFCGCNSIKSLPDFYMLNKYKNDVIFEVTYKNNEGKVKILGKNFIEKKKDNGSIIYNNSEFELNEYFEDNDKMNKDTFKLLICLVLVNL
jgi:surface protein